MQRQALTVRQQRLEFPGVDLRYLAQNNVVFRVIDVARAGGYFETGRLPDRRHQQTSYRPTLCGSCTELFAQHARRKSVHLHTDIPALITQIDIQLDDLVSRLAARRVAYPGDHLRGTSRYNAQRFQRKGQTWLVGKLGQTVDQPNSRLQGAVHQARMKDIVSRRVFDGLRQPELCQYLVGPSMDGGDSLKAGSIDQTHPGKRRVQAARL